MRKIQNIIYLLGLAAAVGINNAGVAAEAVPSYEQARQAFEAELAKQPDAPKVSPEDRKVMQHAGEQLAERMPDPGLKVGEKAPDFTLSNAFGKPVHLYEVLEEGPVVLVFYRGAWCPYCNLQLHTLEKSLPHIQRHGAQLVAVTPQKPDKSLEQVKKDGYPFEILSDLDSKVMKAYKLYFEISPELSEVYKRNFKLDLADYNGDGRYVLPVPATFIIDTDAVIRAADANVDYKHRMEPAAIVEALQTLAARQ